jgi:hypothetical protein
MSQRHEDTCTHCLQLDRNEWRRRAEGLAKCLREMIEANPAFHSKPCGAPGSEARIKQDRQIAAEDAARTALEGMDIPLR